MSDSAPPQISLRTATAADARPLGVLGTQVFLETYAPHGIGPLMADEVLAHFSPEAITQRLAHPATTFLVAERAGLLVGFAQLTRDAKPPHADLPGAVELARLYVLERFTGRGVGRRLLQEAERRAAAHHAPLLWLTAWIGNTRALAFYAALGYAECGQTFYDFQGELFENRLFAKTLPRG